MLAPPDILTHLVEPGLVVLTGGPGSGRSTTLGRVSAGFAGPVLSGGGLAILCGTPALPLTRAVRARLPADDPALLAEAVRSRVAGGLLVLDDLQWADVVTLDALPLISAHVRVLVALRTPHRLPDGAEDRLRSAATAWLTVPALSVAEATDLAMATAPGLSGPEVAAVVARAGGLPLAVRALARSGGAGTRDDMAYVVAEAVADLTRPARTALAALGLLGRPAEPDLLGGGLAELTAADLVTVRDGAAAPTSPYVAEVAAGALDPTERRALHQRLAELTEGLEAARHLAAAGDPDAACERAQLAAEFADSAAARAEALLLAASLTTDPAVRTAAARAALTVGRPAAALAVAPADAVAVRAEAHLQSGDPRTALAVLDAEAGDEAASGLAEAGDRAAPGRTGPPGPTAPGGEDPDALRVRILATLAVDPSAAPALLTGLPATPDDPGLRAAVAAVAAHRRDHGWEYALASAATAAGASGDALSARWCAWQLVCTLVADGRLTQARDTARSAAAACAVEVAYSWQSRFVAIELWCAALSGTGLDDVARRAVELADRTLPAVARGYALSAAALAEADAGLTRSARSRLDGVSVPDSPVDWVAAEAAWLDGQPDLALAAGDTLGPLLPGLRRITAHWARLDGAGGTPPPDAPAGPPPVAETLAAWAGRPDRFTGAAQAWRAVAVREEVRCLLALGLLSADPAVAVPPLLAAEALATSSGMVLLAGRARVGLRRHAVRRDPRGPQSDGSLTQRERQVLELVAQGEPTRRIASVLGVSRETVETHIRAGMRKLGARTRTEAAARCLEVL
ncbi:helix-turn-helix transcriptional regulator [Longispora fulva]|uniref:DNA-binding CsgD family transcriptional regulator n=1 Tax=Longispora fulva TaxID=619741 RepID=A0A8J7GBF0_9ACTN|nr:LuxR C-terminal-related transcriptional regulator [Longispora fulva]MBG6135369.1 DNA-binding CsgD family transcriptional regulator [Longispora fulva]